MLTSRRRVPTTALGAEPAEAGNVQHKMVGRQRGQAETRLVYACLTLMLFCSYAAVGKDLLHNPLRYGIFDSVYDEPYNRLRYLTVLLIFGLTLLERRAVAALRSIWFLAPLLGVVAASMLWSSDIIVTARNTFLLAGLVMATAFLIARNGANAFFRTQLHFLALIMLFSAALAIALPDIGRHSPHDVLERGHIGQWRGIFGHKNGLGAYAAIATVQLTLFVRAKGKMAVYWWAARLCAIACLIFAGSATSLSAAIVGFIIYFLLRNRHTSHPFMLSILAGLVIIVAGMIGTGLANVAGLFGRDMTLTGRTEIWTAASAMIGQHFWLGLGYGSHVGVMMDYLRSALFSSAVDTHNGYLDVFAAVGLLGFVGFLFAVMVSLRLAYGAVRRGAGITRDLGLASICIIAMGLTVGMGEVSPFRAVGYGGALFWMSTVLAAMAFSQLRRGNASSANQAT